MVVSRVSVTSVTLPARLMVWRLVVRLGVGRMAANSSSYIGIEKECYVVEGTPLCHSVSICVSLHHEEGG